MKGIRKIRWLGCLLIMFCIFMISNIPQAKGQEAEITFYWIASEGWNIRKNDVMVPLYIVETEWDQYDNVTYEIVKEYQTTLRYLKQVTMEGTGVLNYLRHRKEGLLRKDRMINWGAPCKESATGLCFKTVDRTTHHWGRGSQGNPITPSASRSGSHASPMPSRSASF